MNRLLKWNFRRRFGIEYEFSNSSRTLGTMSEIVREHTGQDAEVRHYEHTRGNNVWVCKTDSSCGIELVSPILTGPRQLKIAAEVLPHLQNGNFNHDTRCGQHVHIEIADYTEEQAGILASWWMKIERFILNGTPAPRRSNSYCLLLTHANSNIDPNFRYEPAYVLSNMARGRNAINFQNWRSGHGGTVEFRFGEMTWDPEVIKNRIRFLIWLVEMCKILPPPQNLNWATPKQALSIFNLWESPDSIIKYQYSPAVTSMRKWLLERVIEHAPAAFARDVERCRAMLEELNNVEAAQTEQEDE